MTTHLQHNKLIRITTVPMALCYLLPGQMKFMSDNGFDVLLISANGKELPDVIKNENCQHIIVNMTRKITPFRDLKCLVQLIRIIRKEKPASVHSHTPKAGLLSMVAARYCGVKIRIHTVAGLPLMVEKGFRFYLLRWVERITSKAATQIWPNSHSILEYMKKFHLADPGKLRVIGKGSSNGIDTGFYSTDNLDHVVIKNIKSGIQYTTENIYLLFTGRLVKDKGVIELIRSFSLLQQKRTNLILLLIGDYEENLDPLTSSTKHLIKTHPSIIHINWTSEVKYFMHLAHYFIFPSHREGFPNVLLQAGAMGLPIICSKIPGNIDIVSHQETGLMFDCDNDQQMVELIDWAIDNPGLMAGMAKNLQQVIQLNYRRENIWQNILEAYKSALN